MQMQVLALSKTAEEELTGVVDPIDWRQKRRMPGNLPLGMLLV